MRQGRVLSLDLLRGIGIVVVLVVHRLHYHWAGMASQDALRARLAGPLMPLLVVLIALFTMAGVFYFVAGFANAYSLAARLRRGSAGRAAAAWHGLAAGTWLLSLNYVHRLLLTNGFASGEGGREPAFPAGMLTGLVRDGRPAPFRWSLVSEPGTLALIGLITMCVSLSVGGLGRGEPGARNRRLYTWLVATAVAVVGLTPFMELRLRPAYDAAYASGHVLEATLLGFVSQEFGLFPYLAFGLVGAALGFACTGDLSPRALERRAGAGAFVLFAAAALALALVDRHTAVGRRILGVSLSCAELALFVGFWLLLSRYFDRGPGERLRATRPQTGLPSSWLWAGIRRFGLVALTVYACEPLVAEILKRPVDFLLGRQWVEHLGLVLAFALACVAAWWLLLAAWEGWGYRGSLEDLAARILGRSDRGALFHSTESASSVPAATSACDPSSRR